MEDWSGEALSRAVKRAVKAYHSPDWKQYVQNGMKYDSSWKKSVEQYRKCYEELVKGRT